MEAVYFLLAVVLIFLLFFASQSTTGFFSKLSPSYRSYTKILCSNSTPSYCVDVYVECDGNKLTNATIISEPILADHRYVSELGWCE
jgi:hypothetical protein